MCGRKKLPFAEYSVVKEPAVAAPWQFRPWSAARVARSPILIATKRIASGFTSAPASLSSGPGFGTEALAWTRDLGEAKAGGEYRARTGDLLVANQALSQLS